MSKPFDHETFTFNGNTLRTVMIDGEPWFIVAVILTALGVQRWKTSNYTHIMDTGEWGGIRFRDFNSLPKIQDAIFPRSKSGQRPTNLSVTSESGLYKIALRAQRSNPAAKAFQDWITKEVIPRIRKNGGYVMGEEKVATGEITVAQIAENHWRYFVARMAALEASVANNHRKLVPV